MSHLYSFQKKSHFSRLPGLTLLEVVIVLGIIGIIGTIVYQFVVSGNRIFVQSRDQALAQDTLRKAIDSIAQELREAQTADNGAYLLEGGNAQFITFYSDIDDDNERERVRYFIEGTNFKKGVIEPSGAPAQYPLENETITTVVSDIRNQDIFTYYDENYTGSEASLPLPLNISQVKLVHLRFDADVNPSQPPPPITLETSVMIRNLKTNL